jgi:hypothetical protein
METPGIWPLTGSLIWPSPSRSDRQYCQSDAGPPNGGSDGKLLSDRAWTLAALANVNLADCGRIGEFEPAYPSAIL